MDTELNRSRVHSRFVEVAAIVVFSVAVLAVAAGPGYSKPMSDCKNPARYNQERGKAGCPWLHIRIKDLVMQQLKRVQPIKEPPAVPDSDGDGWPNDVDSDIDGDGKKNWERDDDMDGDGVSNQDEWPDGDQDGDLVPDSEDLEWKGCGSVMTPCKDDPNDQDGDTVPDEQDCGPSDPSDNSSKKDDFDCDREDDFYDQDDDGDGVADNQDADPHDPDNSACVAATKSPTNTLGGSVKPDSDCDGVADVDESDSGS